MARPRPARNSSKVAASVTGVGKVFLLSGPWEDEILAD